MSDDARSVWFWLAVFLALNVFTLLWAGTYVMFPIMVVCYHFGRMTAQEDVADHDR